MTQPPQGGYPPQPQYPQRPQYPQPQPYAPQAPYPQGPQAYPPQYPVGAPYPIRTGPNKGLGVLKLLVGLCAATGFGIGVFVGSHDGIAIGAVLGLFLGGSVFLLASGGANLAGKKIKLVPALAIIGVCLVLGAAAGPPVSNAYWTAAEKSKWDELLANNSGFPSKYEWDSGYFEVIPEKFHRPEARGQQKLAEVIADIKSSNVVNVREHVRTIQTEHKGDPHYAAALEAATGELKKRYDEALEKLGKPGVQPAGENAIAMDEKLRAAFKTVLTDLAGAPTADVYVAFTNTAKLEKPAGADENVQYLFENNASVKRGFPDGNVKVISPGQAFSSEYDTARRSAFMEAATLAFKDVFDANLLSLRPLGAEDMREGRIIMQVSSTINRVYTHFDYYDEVDGVKKSNGLLFGIVVDWEFKLFDREGKLLYETTTSSKPASQLTIGEGAMPEWGVYSILMDSAYYNYSREVVGRFGLTPPEEKEVFSYRDYGIK